MLAMTLGFVACSNEDDIVEQPEQTKPLSETMTIFATGEACTSDANGAKVTRTKLGADGSQVVWTNGDKFYVGSDAYELDPISEGSTTGSFTGKTLLCKTKREWKQSGLTGSFVYVNYPEDYTAYYYGPNSTSLLVSQTQTYDASSSRIANVPMCAKITIDENNKVSNNVEFKNLCGMLRLRLNNGSTKIRKVREITISSNQVMAGSFTVTNPNEDAPTIKMSGSVKSVTLDCGSEGVELGTSNDFYFILPPGNYDGVTITIKDTEGFECIKKLKADKTLPITRSEITPATFTTSFSLPPSGTIANKDYVDMGPGTTVLWASKNIGAADEEDDGDYFAWGEIEPKSLANDNYDWQYYKFGTIGNFEKYNSTDGLTLLDSDDDVAIKKWGSPWRMPTKAEMDELLDETKFTWKWKSSGTTGGYTITSKSNGQSIYLPAAKYYKGSKDRSGKPIKESQVYGFYWTASLDATNRNYAYYFYFTGTSKTSSSFNRCYGLTVRPVCARPNAND